MQLSSRPQFRFADAMTYIFWFLMLYLTTFASAQQPTEPNNNLQVLSVSIIDGIQLGKSSIRIEFRVDYQSRVFNLECTIEFPSLVGPPNEYSICGNTVKAGAFYLYMAIREYVGRDDFQLEVKEGPYEFMYREEIRFGSPIWRINMTGQLFRQSIDRVGYFSRLLLSQSPHFDWVGFEDAERRRRRFIKY